ncbi:DUF11 domain-containing protein [Sesbania bispinosa]|nr:DUF11 domain-containing protein [Sesbania bispinosa]
MRSRRDVARWRRKGRTLMLLHDRELGAVRDCVDDGRLGGPAAEKRKETATQRWPCGIDSEGGWLLRRGEGRRPRRRRGTTRDGGCVRKPSGGSYKPLSTMFLFCLEFVFLVLLNMNL